MSSITKAFFVILGLTAFSDPAYAYLDPGTGSMIAQFVFGLIAAAGIAIKSFWDNIMSFFYSVFRTSDKKAAENPDKDE